jgi:hypothetical protein
MLCAQNQCEYNTWGAKMKSNKVDTCEILKILFIFTKEV